MKHKPVHSNRTSHGFTLVELLMVIVIMGILLGIAIPAIMAAISRGRATEMRMEIGAIEQAIERYHDKYGDYPPDFSSWTVVERHYRKIFPRIAPGELERLQLLTDDDPSNDNVLDLTTVTPGAHVPTILNRDEVLVWVLGGYSSNPLLPFTGPGGPLEIVTHAGTPSGEILLQFNIDRDNSLYEFDPSRLDLSTIDPAATLTTANRYYSTGDISITTDDDLFPSYAVREVDDGAGPPFVYFDSRTYASFSATIGDFNGYGSADYGLIRPYYSNLAVANPGGTAYGTLTAACGAWQFMKPDKFQLIAPGLDGNFGTVASFEFDPSQTGFEPLYFQYPTGQAIAPSTVATMPGALLLPDVRAFQESTITGSADDFQLDNITNFSKLAIIDDLDEG